MVPIGHITTPPIAQPTAKGQSIVYYILTPQHLLITPISYFHWQFHCGMSRCSMSGFSWRYGGSGDMNRLFKIQRQCEQPWWPVAANGLDPKILTMIVMGWWLSVPSSDECSRKVYSGDTISSYPIERCMYI